MRHALVFALFCAVSATGCLYPIQSQGNDADRPDPVCSDGELKNNCTCPQGYKYEKPLCVVLPPVRSLEVPGLQTNMQIGASQTVTASAAYVSGPELGDVSFQWITSNPDLVELSSGSGATISIKAKAAGYAQVSVTLVEDGDATTTSRSFTIAIVGKPRDFLVERNPNVESLGIGATMQLVAAASGEGLGEYTVGWTSSSPEVASIAPAQGRTVTVTALATGYTILTATLVEGGQATTLTKQFGLTVTPPAARVSRVAIFGLAQTASANQSLEFTVQLFDVSNQPTTLQGAEKLSFTPVGLAQPTLVEGLKYRTSVQTTEGAAYLTATWQGSTNVNSEASFVSIQAAPTYGFFLGSNCARTGLDVVVGSRTDLKPAIVTNGACQPLEPTAVEWSLGAGLLSAGVDAAAQRVFAAEAGTRTLTYTYGGQQSGTFTFTVQPQPSLVESGATATSCTTVSAIALNLDTAPSKVVLLRQISKMSLQNAAQKCDVPAGITANQWYSQAPTQVRVDVDGTDATKATVVGLGQAQGISIGVEAGAASTGAAVTVTGTPLTFGGTATATWTTARTYSVAWSQAASVADAHYRIYGSNGAQGTIVIAADVTGLTANITVPSARTDWKLSVEAFKDARVSGRLAVTTAPLAATPAQPVATVVGDDGGAYALALDGSTTTFLGLLVKDSTGAVRTAPRADGSGTLYALGVDPTSGATVPLVRAPLANSPWQTRNWGRFTFETTPACGATQPYVTAFPAGAELVYLTPNAYLACGTGGSLYVSNSTTQKTLLISDRVTSATNYGATNTKVAYVSNGTLYVLDAGALSTAVPRAVSTAALTAGGYLVGAGEKLYYVRSGAILEFDPASASAGAAITLPQNFALALTASGYGLPGGQLLLPTSTGIAVATVGESTLTVARTLTAPAAVGTVSTGVLAGQE